MNKSEVKDPSINTWGSNLLMELRFETNAIYFQSLLIKISIPEWCRLVNSWNFQMDY